MVLINLLRILIYLIPLSISINLFIIKNNIYTFKVFIEEMRNSDECGQMN